MAQKPKHDTKQTNERTTEEEKKGNQKTSEEDKPSQLDGLLAIAGRVPYLRTPEGGLFAEVFYKTGMLDILPLNTRFKLWLNLRYFEENGHVPQDTILQKVVELMQQFTAEQAPMRPLFTRVGCQDGVLYLDLANGKREIVKIEPTGWTIVQQAPVLFRKPPGLLPLPRPVGGGSLKELWDFVPVEKEDRSLILGYALMLLHPDGPYPILVLNGEEGSAKSYATKCIRSLVDPRTPISRSMPREDRDLAICAQHSWVVALENLSYVPDWLSDALCRLATGSGLGKRKNYSDDDEILFFAKRPVIVNGIGSLVKNSDLLSRCIVVTMPVMSSDAYKSERLLDAEYKEAQPRLLGALLDATVVALANRGSCEVSEKSRMVDMLEWVQAAAPALDGEVQTFTKRYRDNREEHLGAILGASQVAEAIELFFAHLVMVKKTTVWEGTTEQLDSELREVLTKVQKFNEKKWPADLTRLSNALTKLGPALRSRGYDIKRHRKNVERLITITYTPVNETKEGDAKRDASTFSASPNGTAPQADCDASDASDAKSATSLGQNGYSKAHEIASQADSDAKFATIIGQNGTSNVHETASQAVCTQEQTMNMGKDVADLASPASPASPDPLDPASRASLHGDANSDAINGLASPSVTKAKKRKPKMVDEYSTERIERATPEFLDQLYKELEPLAVNVAIHEGCDKAYWWMPQDIAHRLQRKPAHLTTNELVELLSEHMVSDDPLVRLDLMLWMEAEIEHETSRQAIRAQVQEQLQRYRNGDMPPLPFVQKEQEVKQNGYRDAD